MTNQTEQITHIELHRTSDIFFDSSQRVGITTKTFKQCLEILATEQVNPILSVSWRVVVSAPVTVEKQNKNALRRAAKMATVLGRKVESFDQLNGVTYGVALV